MLGAKHVSNPDATPDATPKIKQLTRFAYPSCFLIGYSGAVRSLQHAVQPCTAAENPGRLAGKGLHKGIRDARMWAARVSCSSYVGGK